MTYLWVGLFLFGNFLENFSKTLAKENKIVYNAIITGASMHPLKEQQ